MFTTMCGLLPRFSVDPRTVNLMHACNRFKWFSLQPRMQTEKDAGAMRDILKFLHDVEEYASLREMEFEHWLTRIGRLDDLYWAFSLVENYGEYLVGRVGSVVTEIEGILSIGSGQMMEIPNFSRQFVSDLMDILCYGEPRC